MSAMAPTHDGSFGWKVDMAANMLRPCSASRNMQLPLLWQFSRQRVAHAPLRERGQLKHTEPVVVVELRSIGPRKAASFTNSASIADLRSAPIA